ncbi:hypothetical protein PPM_1625 [Paenibacillus polymyxa M1]|uniref:hypothetical protein n=1 Tax=Paenibacillus polymyxa TaxID=1406 RepID=UPI0001E6CAD6|nr:hypothetical protein [Paenibacillus polymyxa]CCC84562.1 hypothetical protein PPM_1625 [Paenibacillus polymyxa M1]
MQTQPLQDGGTALSGSKKAKTPDSHNLIEWAQTQFDFLLVQEFHANITGTEKVKSMGA